MEDPINDTSSQYNDLDDCDYIGEDYDDLENAEELGPDDDNELISLDEIIQKNVSRNIRDLRTFFTMNNLVTEKGDQKTNIVNVAEKKTYCIPSEHIEEFFGAIELCRRESRLIHYSERQDLKSGIMIDFDRYQRTKDVQICEKHFEALTRHIGKILRDLIDFSDYATDDKYSFKIFYIRKPSIVLIPPKVQGEAPKYKDGFHILIPEIMVSKGLKRFLQQELVNKNVLKMVFKDIDHIGEPEEMLDMMSCSVPVQFVGNTRPGKPPYLLTHGWDVIFYIGEDEVDRRPLDIDAINSGEIKLTRDGPPTPINLTYELSLSFNLPSILGKPTWLKKREMDYRVSLETKIQLLVEKTSKDIISDEDIMDVENSVDLLALNNAEANYLKKLLGILDISYATVYKKWFAVIMAIGHTSTNYKPLAIWFSHRKPESWNVSEIDRVWAEATSGKHNRAPVTKRSIRHWARESSPQAFEVVEKENYFNVLARETYANEGRVEHAGASKVTFSMTGYKFVVDVGRSELTGRIGYVWFEFVTPGQPMRKGEVFKWRKECDPDNVHLFVGEHLPKVYGQLSANIKDRKDNAANEGETKYWAMVHQNFKLSTSRLGNDGFQKGVISQSRFRFRQRGFFDELDSYEDVIGVGNGILKIGVKAVLIKGFHEYKISKFTEVNYVPYDKTNPRIKILKQALKDVWIEKDVYKFIMMHASTGLDRKESANILLICVGGGRNGKSFTVKMIHAALGNMYCSSGKATLLTAPMEKGGDANSAQMQQRDMNFFYIDEFEPCSTLNTTRLKQVVSPGQQSGRDLYEKQTNFRNISNLVCYSNFDFIVDTVDHGTWRRIYYYKNKVKFCDNPDPSNPYEKQNDNAFVDEYPNDPLYKEAMLSILTHYRCKLQSKYRGDLKRIPVPTIKRETEKFRNRQDSLNRFIVEMIVKTSNPDDEVGVPTLTTRYTDWYNRSVKQQGGKSAIADAQSQFENSRIAPDLKLNKSGIYMLHGHRVKNFPDEPLQEGETSLWVAPPAGELNGEVTTDDAVKDTTAEYADNVAEYVDNVADKDTLYIDNLTKNAPTYIQSMDRDHKDDHDNEIADALNGLMDI